VVDEVGRELTNWALNGGTLAAVDAIALLESGVRDFCTAVVGITAPDELRLRRIMEREGISEEYARMRIAAQKTNAYYERHCSVTLHNDGTPESFHETCRALFQQIIGGIQDGKHGTYEAG
jgi:dephospho-CoA kinase